MATGTDNAAGQLVGGYTVTAGEKFGKPEPEDRIYGTIVRFTADRVTVTDKRDQHMYSATYQVDATSTPWKIVMTADNAPNSGDMARGLVEKTGDTVRLIYALPGQPEPTDFRTKPGQLMFEMTNFNKGTAAGGKALQE